MLVTILVVLDMTQVKCFDIIFTRTRDFTKLCRNNYEIPTMNG